MRKVIIFAISVLLFMQCSISYKFTGASIDYTKVKTLSVALFPNEAPLVADPGLSQAFTEGLKDYFMKQTRLDLKENNGDLQFEGEITDYDIKPQSIQADMTAAQTRVTMKVNVRFMNTTDPEQDFEKGFSAYVDYDSSENFESIKETIREELLDQIFENIFNESVANW